MGSGLCWLPRFALAREFNSKRRRSTAVACCACPPETLAKRALLEIFALIAGAACSPGAELEPAPALLVARFDPAAKYSSAAD